MNYLAHLYFAAPTADSRVGNLMGDFARGRINPDWPIALKEGVWLHRKIDVYTDSHADVLIAKSRFSAERRRIAGIIIDIAFDHFLCRHWSNYSKQPLAQFINDIYRDLSRYQGYLPEKMVRPLAMLVQQDWLSVYASVEGISLTLDRVSRRFIRPTNLFGSGEELRLHYDLLEQDFLRFFPDLVAHVDALKQSTAGDHGGFGS